MSGPWRLKSYTEEGIVTFVPNEHYSGPIKATLDEFRQIPTFSDEEQYQWLEAGAEAEHPIQVGYLPLSFATEPTSDPTVGGANPLVGHPPVAPADRVLHPVLLPELQQPDGAGQDLRPDLLPAGAAEHAGPGRRGP